MSHQIVIYDRILRNSVALVLLFAILIRPLPLFGQEQECDYQPGNPSIDHARQTFRSADLFCAELELKELLQDETITRAIKADAHMLLASIYFVGDDDAATRRSKAKRELVSLFLADRHWQGQLEIQSSDFLRILADARDQAEWRYRNSPELKAEYERTIEVTDSLKADSVAVVKADNQDKKWYTKWWAVGSGIGIIAMAAILMSGGSDGTEPVPVDTLPGFPDTP